MSDYTAVPYMVKIDRLQRELDACRIQNAELKKDRDRWFLRVAAVLDAINDTCDRGYCVLGDYDCVLGTQEAGAAVAAAMSDAPEPDEEKAGE